MQHDLDNSIYNQLGDKKLQELVDAFYERVYQDPILKPLFTNDIEIVKDKQFCFLTQFLGGPPRYIEKYGPPRMRMRHLPHKIDQKAMVSWLACMKEAISTLDIPEKLANDIYQKFPKLAHHMLNS